MAVGEDPGEINKDELQTSLVKAREDQLEVFSAKQRYLNCKSFEQYCEAYIEWLVGRCFDKETVIAELDWVRGFRIVFLKATKDPVGKEKESKEFIVHEFLRRIGSEDFRCQVALDYAKCIGLI